MKSTRRSWQIAGILIALLVGMALAAEEHELTTVELETASTEYEGPESLAEQVRYSEPFSAAGGVRVEVEAKDAEVYVSLVDSEEQVRELSAWVSDRETLSFGRVPEQSYRLRVAARSRHDHPLRVRALTGGFSPTLLAIAVFLLLVPPLSWTLRRNLR